MADTEVTQLGDVDSSVELTDDQAQRESLPVPEEFERDRGSGFEKSRVDDEVAHPLQGTRVEGDDDVAGLEPRLIRWAVGAHLLNQHAGRVPRTGQLVAGGVEAAESQEPHHLAYYLRDVAGLWNPYLQDGKAHRILSDDAALTAARLGLSLATRVVLKNGLALLGITAPEQM